MSHRDWLKQADEHAEFLKVASQTVDATIPNPVVVSGREVNVQSKWIGGDPPFVVTDGNLECLDERGDWSDILHEAKIFSTHNSAAEFAKACADKELAERVKGHVQDAAEEAAKATGVTMEQFAKRYAAK